MIRILAVDPGALRLGWAVLERKQDRTLEVIDSGVLGLARGQMGAKNEEYQLYKLRLIDYFVKVVPPLFQKYLPTRFINETQPAVGGGNFIAATQSELAKTAVTIFQVFAYINSIPVTQIGSTTIKKAVGKNKSATKAKVRDGVIEVFPNLAKELKIETTGSKPVWDRSDAIATGIAYFATKVKDVL